MAGKFFKFLSLKSILIVFSVLPYQSYTEFIIKFTLTVVYFGRHEENGGFQIEFEFLDAFNLIDKKN